MQHQTGTRSRPMRKPQPPASDVLLKVGTKHPKFWFLVWLANMQRHAAINRVFLRALRAKRCDDLIVDALCAAKGHYEQEVHNMAAYCQRAGLLLLCWESTRAIDDVEVAA